MRAFSIRPRVPLRVLAGLALAVLALAAAGCGSSSTGASTRTPAQSRALQLLSQKDIDAVPVDSPAHTILVWWRYLQYKDPRDALDLFSPGIRADVTNKGGFDLVQRDLGPWLTNIRPKVVDTVINGATATVFLRVLINTPVGTNIVKTSQDSLAIPLVKESRRWLINDSTFFLSQGALLRANRLRAEAAARAQQKK